MPISRRYSPSWAPGEGAVIGMDFSFVVPPGVGLVSGTLHFFDNLPNPVNADADWTIGPVEVFGRTLYASLAGGAQGKDYQVQWVAQDTEGYTWPRTALMLCAPTS